MRYLRDSDLAAWMCALRSPLAQPATIVQWLEGPLREFFPFERVILVHGSIIVDKLTISHLLQVGYSLDFVSNLQKTFDISIRGGLNWWLKNRRPFFIDPSEPPHFVSDFELAEIEQFNLGNVVGHGILNIDSSSGAYLSFSGVPRPLGPWHIDALSLITPQLIDLYTRHVVLQRSNRPESQFSFTTREKSIIQLLVEGTDSKTIGRVLGISEKTVRNQLTKLYASAGVRSRGQLISRFRTIMLKPENTMT